MGENRSVSASRREFGNRLALEDGLTTNRLGLNDGSLTCHGDRFLNTTDTEFGIDGDDAGATNLDAFSRLTVRKPDRENVRS